VIDLNYDQISNLIDLASNKDIYDWVTLLLPNFITITTIITSYYYFTKQAKQITLERIIEKEVDRLYEAADLFFSYSNAVGLYFSMSEKEFHRIATDKEMEESFTEKLKESSGNVYNSFANMHKAEFIMNSLGETTIAVKLKKYRESTIEYRESIFKILESYRKDKSLQLINEFLANYDNKTKAIEKQKLELLKEIADAKPRLKLIKI
jgi:hypothetical protein